MGDSDRFLNEWFNFKTTTVDRLTKCRNCSQHYLNDAIIINSLLLIIYFTYDANFQER